MHRGGYTDTATVRVSVGTCSHAVPRAGALIGGPRVPGRRR